MLNQLLIGCIKLYLGRIKYGDAGEESYELEDHVQVGNRLGISKRRHDLRREHQRNVDDNVPEGDERHEIIRLVRSVHAQANDHRHHIHSKQHLCTQIQSATNVNYSL